MTSHSGDVALTFAAVVLMLGGVVMIFTGSSSALAIALIAVGIALVAVMNVRKRRQHMGSAEKPS